MHITPTLIYLLAVFYFVVMAISLWLSLKIFGLIASGNTLQKISAYQAGCLAILFLISYGVGGRLTNLLNFVFLVAGVSLWAMLIKHYLPDKYSAGKAVGSYFTSYVFATGFVLVISLICLAIGGQVFIVDGNSMSPALKANQTVLVYKFEKHPKKDDVIIYKNLQTGKNAFGRVQGVPGDSVTLTSGPDIAAMSEHRLGPTEYYVTTDNKSYNIPPKIIQTNSIIGTVGPEL